MRPSFFSAQSIHCGRRNSVIVTGIIDENSPTRMVAKMPACSPSTITGILQRLETRKLVVRTRTREDRRVSRLALTTRGRNLVFRAPEPPRSRVFRTLSRLGAAELRETRRSLQRVERAMRGANVEGED